MPKSDSSRPLPGYSTVAERVTLFYARFPTGRIVTRLVARSERDVVFRAAVYRAPDERRPAATGWAAEREGDGDVNTVACLENTETSAVGRALANLGLTASRERPSAEEMAKAARARGRSAPVVLERPRTATPGQNESSGEESPPSPTPTRGAGGDALRSALEADLLRLIAGAEELGVRRPRVARWCDALRATALPTATLIRVERRLRAWIARRQP